MDAWIVKDVGTREEKRRVSHWRVPCSNGGKIYGESTQAAIPAHWLARWGPARPSPQTLASARRTMYVISMYTLTPLINVTDTVADLVQFIILCFVRVWNKYIFLD